MTNTRITAAEAASAHCVAIKSAFAFDRLGVAGGIRWSVSTKPRVVSVNWRRKGGVQME